MIIARIATPAGLPGAVATALVGIAIALGGTMPARLVSISRVPDFVATCDDVDRDMLARRFDDWLDRVPPGWSSPRWMASQAPTHWKLCMTMLAPRISLVWDSDEGLRLLGEGEREVGTPLRLAEETAGCGGQFEEELVDLDGDGVVELVEIRWRSQAIVRVIRMRDQQLEISAFHSFRADAEERDWKKAARWIARHASFTTYEPRQPVVR